MKNIIIEVLSVAVVGLFCVYVLPKIWKPKD